MRGPTFFHCENGCVIDGKTSCRLCAYLFHFSNHFYDLSFVRNNNYLSGFYLRLARLLT